MNLQYEPTSTPLHVSVKYHSSKSQSQAPNTNPKTQHLHVCVPPPTVGVGLNTKIPNGGGGDANTKVFGVRPHRWGWGLALEPPNTNLKTKNTRSGANVASPLFPTLSQSSIGSSPHTIPKPLTLNPKPSTLNPQFSTLNPGP